MMDIKVTDQEIEAVARAICEACGDNPDHVGDARGNEWRWQDYVIPAGRAVEAMKPAAGMRGEHFVTVERRHPGPDYFAGGEELSDTLNNHLPAGTRLYLAPQPAPDTVAKAEYDALAEQFAAVQRLYYDARNQAARVPEGWLNRAKNLLLALGHQGVTLNPDEPPYDVGEWGIKEAQELYSLLSAAPQPEVD